MNATAIGAKLVSLNGVQLDPAETVLLLGTDADGVVIGRANGDLEFHRWKDLRMSLKVDVIPGWMGGQLAPSGRH